MKGGRPRLHRNGFPAPVSDELAQRVDCRGHVRTLWIRIAVPGGPRQLAIGEWCDGCGDTWFRSRAQVRRAIAHAEDERAAARAV